MKKIVGIVLVTALTVVSFASPASANAGAAWRNVVLLGAAAAAALGITNYNHKKHLRDEHDEENGPAPSFVQSVLLSQDR